ncbi:MAG TPA: molybdate ABC transporter substrate-binding protein [Candidatus Nanopelagicaceae bacterium]|nr:molybdate ABC transporter substrate-binding protein [Candidatus Nanopelagicaceae bacterium]
MPNSRRSRLIILLSVVLIAVALIGLVLRPRTSPSATNQNTNLTIFGAASLTAVLPELGSAFHSLHPKAHFTFSFAGSSTLAQQIISGAPADLFFAAGPDPMATVRTAHEIVGRSENFTSNSLVIAVPRANPAAILGLNDFDRKGITYLICAKEVPCGTAAAKVLALARISAKPVSLENDVKSVLTKVSLGEVDAGLVYRTDITGDVLGIEFPEASAAINKYPVAVIKGSEQPGLAHEFINFVLSAKGQAILQEAGFGPL